MGACECKNPMEFGYEISAEKSTNNNNRINNNITPIISNVPNSGIYKEKEKNNKYNICSSHNNHNKCKEEVKLNAQNSNQRLEGVKALKARLEEDNKIQDVENSENYYNNNIDKKKDKINSVEDGPIDEFSRYIFEKINEIRENPKSFIPTIQKGKKNIQIDKSGICIYKSSGKIALSRGEPAFDEAIEFLENLEPMKKLYFNRELLITLPQIENEIKNKTYMNDLINEKVQAGIPIKSFWRDIIKDKQDCILLMIVDDTGANSGKKRNDILDPDMESIGIISKKIGKYFASYVILC